MVKEQASTLILGVAVIEDIIIISMLAILQSITSSEEVSCLSEISNFHTLGIGIHRECVIHSSIVFPKFVNYIGNTNQHDLLIVAVLGVAFGLSFVAYEIGISVATGVSLQAY